jgi:hypothetical protein
MDAEQIGRQVAEDLKRGRAYHAAILVLSWAEENGREPQQLTRLDPVAELEMHGLKRRWLTSLESGEINTVGDLLDVVDLAVGGYSPLMHLPNVSKATDAGIRKLVQSVRQQFPHL